MHTFSEEVKTRFEKVFNKKQSMVLTEVFIDLHDDIVKAKDFNELKGIVKELAEAQKASEKRLTGVENRLTRIETIVKELAEAQKRTEEVLQHLIVRVEKVEDRLEGISNSVGYSLENTAYKSLPQLLKKEGIEIVEKIIRRYYNDNQINIFARGKREDKDILILGEVKVRPSKIEIDRFIKIAEQVRREEGNLEVYLIFVAHDYHPNTESYLKDKGIRYFWSYELEI